MFHGCLFDDNYLVLCILLGWLLWAGLLNKKVHFPDAKVRVISVQTSIASRKTFFTPFLWTRALVCATKTTVFCINSVRYFFEMPSRTLRDSFQIAHSLCHCGLDPQSHTRSIRRNTLRLYFLDRMGCRVEPGRTRARNKRLKMLPESAPRIGTFSLSSFTSFFNVVLTIGSEKGCEHKNELFITYY